MNVNLKVPKKYQKYFGCLEAEPGLIDDCKYMLYFADGYAWCGEYPSVPVKSKKEAIEFLKEGALEKPYYDGGKQIIAKECPICGKIYKEPSAISRKDNKTEICPDCGTKEALNKWITYNTKHIMIK